MPALLLLAALACLDTSGVRKRIRAQLKPVRACYAQALQEQAPDFGGKLVLQFLIASNGTVSEATVKSAALHSEKFETCLVDAVKKWSFPPVPGGGTVSITYPFIFKPSR